MKKIALTFLLFVAVNLSLVAQDKIDKLADKVDKLADKVDKLTDKVDKLTEQVAEIAKQQAVTNAEIKNLDKRFDVQTSYIITIFAGIFAIVAAIMALVMWDRRTSAKPYEEKTEKLQAEITLLKEKELRHEEKMEAYFRKIAQIDARFTAIL